MMKVEALNESEPLVAIPSIPKLKFSCSPHCIKVIVALGAAMALSSTFFIRAYNLHSLGDNNALNIALYLIAGCTTQLYFEMILPRQWMRRSNNWVNSWMLEIFELITQLSLNIHPTSKITKDLTRLSICLLGGSTVSRMLISFINSRVSSKDQFEVLHPVIHQSEAPVIHMLEGPNNDLRWTAALKAIQAAGATVLLVFAYTNNLKWAKISGGVLAGYCTLGMAGRGWNALKGWMRQRHPQIIERGSISNIPAADKFKAVGQVCWDLRTVFIGALMSTDNIATYIFAGSVIGISKDRNKDSFERSRTHHPVVKDQLIPDSTIAKVREIARVFPFIALVGFNCWNMIDNPLPAKFAAGAETLGLLLAWWITRKTYFAFHDNPEATCSERELRSRYFYLIQHCELLAVCFSIIRQLTPLTDTSLNKGLLSGMTLTAIVGFGLFGAAWGNNRGLQGLISDIDHADVPPSLLALYLMAITVTKFWKG